MSAAKLSSGLEERNRRKRLFFPFSPVRAGFPLRTVA